MKLLLAIVNVLAAAGVLLWPMLALSTAMMFDAPGSERNPITRLLALSILTYPIWPVLGNILFWIKRSSAPTGWLVGFTVVSLLGYMLIVGLFVLLDIVCDGNFAC
ncbi:MAG: hypothetical protein AAGF99_08335 [Bacteroidota bacterium]